MTTKLEPHVKASLDTYASMLGKKAINAAITDLVMERLPLYEQALDGAHESHLESIKVISKLLGMLYGFTLVMGIRTEERVANLEQGVLTEDSIDALREEFMLDAAHLEEIGDELGELMSKSIFADLFVDVQKVYLKALLEDIRSKT